MAFTDDLDLANNTSVRPDQSKDEVDYLVKGGKPTKVIIDKAVAHAKDRMSKGQSPFKEGTFEDKTKETSGFKDDLNIVPTNVKQASQTWTDALVDKWSSVAETSWNVVKGLPGFFADTLRGDG